MRKLCDEGVTFKCPGRSCNACRDSIALANGLHRLDYKIFVVADMLWTKEALGVKASCCSLCGHERGSGGGGYDSGDAVLFTQEDFEAVNADFYALMTAHEELGDSSDFWASLQYAAFLKKHPKHVGPNHFSFLPSIMGVLDNCHTGMALAVKDCGATIIAYALKLESEGKSGLARLVSALRKGALHDVARRIELVIKDVEEYNKTIGESTAHGSGSATSMPPPKSLIKSYVRGLKTTARLRAECAELGISTKEGASNKVKDVLVFEVERGLDARAAAGLVSSLHLLSGDRLAPRHESEVLAGAAASVAYSMTIPQLGAILNKRMQLKGQEVRTMLSTKDTIIGGLNPEANLVSQALTRSLRALEPQLE